MYPSKIEESIDGSIVLKLNAGLRLNDLKDDLINKINRICLKNK